MKLATDGLVMPAWYTTCSLLVAPRSLRQLSLVSDLRRYFREPAEAHPWARQQPVMKERQAYRSIVFLGKLRSDCVSVQPPDASVGDQGCLRHVLCSRNLARGPCLLMEEGKSP